MKKLTGIFLFFLSFFSNAQPDTCHLRISLLTCTPGEELYSIFGHSALRVVDNSSHTDRVFNYGTFDFEDPDFYKKFIRGKLLYFVSVDSLPAFLEEYRYTNRGVTEQVIRLRCEEKQKLLTALLENAREENKYYRYDFTYDNCTTRLRDMLEKTLGNELPTKNILPEHGATFRHLIHSYLDHGGQQWSKLGIDILLGSSLDKKLTNRETMFLPDYLMKALDSATLNEQPLVAEKQILLHQEGKTPSASSLTPFVVFLLLFLIIAVLSVFRWAPGKLFLKIFDLVFFITLGLLGVLLLFMWWGTDHAMCRNNFNLLWALPIHLPGALLIFRCTLWSMYYFRFLFFYTLLLLLTWYLLPQQFNPALLSVVGLVLIRSFFISKTMAISLARGKE